MYYDIIKHHDLDHFVIHVNNAIEQGWTPLGGVSQDGLNYVQALHKPQDIRDKHYTIFDESKKRGPDDIWAVGNMNPDNTIGGLKVANKGMTLKKSL